MEEKNIKEDQKDLLNIIFNRCKLHKLKGKIFRYSVSNAPSSHVHERWVPWYAPQGSPLMWDEGALLSNYIRNSQLMQFFYKYYSFISALSFIMEFLSKLPL